MYLFEKFRQECSHLQRPSSRHSISHLSHSHMPATMSHPSRPILAIDTAPTQPTHRHSNSIPIQQQQQQQQQQQPQHRDVYPGDVRNTPSSAPRPMQDATPNSSTSRAAAPSMCSVSVPLILSCVLIRMLRLQKCIGNEPKKSPWRVTSVAVRYHSLVNIGLVCIDETILQRGNSNATVVDRLVVSV